MSLVTFFIFLVLVIVKYKNIRVILVITFKTRVVYLMDYFLSFVYVAGHFALVAYFLFFCVMCFVLKALLLNEVWFDGVWYIAGREEKLVPSRFGVSFIKCLF